MIEPNRRQSHANFTWMPKIIDRYVGREFMVSYVIAMLVVLSLRIILDLFVEFDEFVEARADQQAPGALTIIGYIVDYYGPKSFEFFRDFSGTIVILAAAFALARMTRQNELTAVLASGISLKRVIMPIVLLSFLLNLLMVLDQELILPRFADKLVRRHDEMKQLRTVRVWLLPDRNGALFSGRYDHEKQGISDLFVIVRSEGRIAGLVNADYGRWNAEGQYWELQNGRYLNHKEPGSATVELTRYPSDLSANFLWLQRNATSKTFMSYRDLRKLQVRAVKQAQIKDLEGEKHFRFTDPIINMVMLLLGLPLLVSRERRSTKTAIFLALLGAGGCFVATFACKLLAGGVLPPLLAAWIPIIVFAPLSVVALDGLKT